MPGPFVVNRHIGTSRTFYVSYVKSLQSLLVAVVIRPTSCYSVTSCVQSKHSVYRRLRKILRLGMGTWLLSILSFPSWADNAWLSLVAS